MPGPLQSFILNQLLYKDKSIKVPKILFKLMFISFLINSFSINLALINSFFINPFFINSFFINSDFFVHPFEREDDFDADSKKPETHKRSHIDKPLCPWIIGKSINIKSQA